MICHRRFWKKANKERSKACQHHRRIYKSIWLSRKWYNKSGYKRCNVRENNTWYMPYWRGWGCKDENLHSRTYQNGTSEHLCTSAKGLASNLVCLFKNVHVAISNKVLEFKENRWLFARNAAKSCPDMHLKECLSNLWAVPRSLFVADNTMLQTLLRVN